MSYTERETPRGRRIAETLAAQRRAQRRRRALVWLGLALVFLGVASAGTLAIAHYGGHAQAIGTKQPGPEGMPLPTGPVLASDAAAAGGAPVDGIRCEADEQVAYHIHAQLSVFVDGAPRQVPYGIGVVTPVVYQTARGPFASATRCYYWLHTHAADGVIHVESPTRRQYTLGDFFDIWRQPLDATRVGPATGTVTAYVDGVSYRGDPRGIVLAEHRDIQLDVGTPLVPPQPVDWSGSTL